MLQNVPRLLLFVLLAMAPTAALADVQPVREQGAALTSLQLLDDAIHAANASLGKAALIACQFDDVSPGTVTENNVSPIRCSNLRELFGIIRDAAGNARGANVNASNELLVSLSSVPTHAVTQSGTWTMQPGNTANTTPWLATISQGGNAAAVNASGQLSITCANCSGSGASAVDDAAFTPASGSGAPIMGMADEVTPDSVNEGDAGVVRMSLNRNLYSSIRDAAGNERGANVNASNELTTSANTELPAAVSVTATGMTVPSTAPWVLAALGCYNGSTLDLCQGASNIAHDAAASAANPTLIGGYASAAAPTDVSADLDAVRAWFLRNGAQAIQSTFAGVLATTGNGASGTGVQRVTIANDSTGTLVVTQPTGSNLHIVCDSGCSGGTTYTHDAALTVGSTVGVPAMGRASAAAPTDVSADGDAVLPWHLRSGAFVVQPTYGGVLGATGSGASGTGTPRVMLSSDSALAANQSVNVAQINGVTPLMGAGNTGTGSPRMTLATDQAAIPTWGKGATGSAVPSGAQYTGVNSGGNLTGLIACNNYAKYDASTSGSTQIIALSGSTTVYICGYSVMTGGTATNVKLVYGTGTNCATSPADITPAWPLLANSGKVVAPALWSGLKTAATGQAVCLNASAANAVQAEVWYTQF